MNPLTLLGFLSFLLVPVIAAPAADASDISIGDILNALGVGLLTHINVNITLDTLTDNLVSIDFALKNPLIFELTLDSVTSTAGVNGTVFASFEHRFSPPLVLPILGTATSGVIDNVLLTQGAIASLDIIPLGVLDLIDTDVNARVATIDGILGIPLVITGLKQAGIPTTYNLDLS
ncbi:hypothetical protein C8J56DRAFT_1049188 [Mycena floridula]|nr:hypothetical protein C8J56DRAFT_1049188 [Mycena floridula]